MKTVLTGIKPTGKPHIGNYLGAIMPALKQANSSDTRTLLFIADYHSLTSMHKAEELKAATFEVAATWLACGLDPDKVIIYRQSDIPEIFELSWILSCFTPKGFMNRAHAYKARVQENQEAGKSDLDFGVNMGLYLYPVLMSADILLFDTDTVPVGEDQVQHVEFARDIAQKINHNYKKELLKLPKASIQDSVKTIPGLDGRKMSKSYGNTIPIFETEKKLRKLIMKIVTDSLPPEAPKDPSTSTIFHLYKEFASEKEIAELKALYEKGIGWGEAKQHLFEAVNKEITPLREKYNELCENPQQVEDILQEGAKKARLIAKDKISLLRQTLGL
ncbi:MAG: tryptophan--tRNA ligase [Bdellovibrionales bacterium]|nr:tryptophan--tRNA ligase [Bdellovibrionales bacterium]